MDDRDDEESGGGEGQAVGAAYAFSSNDEAKLKIRGVLAPSDGAADDSFGMSVAMDKRDNSGTVAVGAALKDGGGKTLLPSGGGGIAKAGRAYVFGVPVGQFSMGRRSTAGHSTAPDDAALVFVIVVLALIGAVSAAYGAYHWRWLVAAFEEWFCGGESITGPVSSPTSSNAASHSAHSSSSPSSSPLSPPGFHNGRDNDDDDDDDDDAHAQLFSGSSSSSSSSRKKGSVSDYESESGAPSARRHLEKQQQQQFNDGERRLPGVVPTHDPIDDAVMGSGDHSIDMDGPREAAGGSSLSHVDVELIGGPSGEVSEPEMRGGDAFL